MIPPRVIIRVRDVMKADFATIDGIATVEDALKKDEIAENFGADRQQAP